MAALAPIVTEAGGRFTGLDGVDGVHRATRPRATGCCTTTLLVASRLTRRLRAAAGSCRRTRATGSAGAQRLGVGAVDEVRPGDGARADRRWDAPGACQPVTSPFTTRAGRSGPSTRSVQPARSRTTPSASAADSSARVTVVPDCDHPTAPRAGRCSRRGGRARVPGSARAAAARRRPATRRRCAAVIGATPMPRVDQLGDELGGDTIGRSGFIFNVTTACSIDRSRPADARISLPSGPTWPFAAPRPAISAGPACRTSLVPS